MTLPLRAPADFCYPPGLVSVDDARAFMLERARNDQPVETCELEQSLGRVLARPVKAPVDVPGYENSAMDGYAIRAADVGESGETVLRIGARIAAGEVAPALAPGQAARIFTGAPVPAGADTIVIQEVCSSADGHVRINGPVRRGEYVRPRGNDIRSGQRIMEAGERLRPQHIGLAASVGLAELQVRAPLRIGMFSSGNELVAPGRPLQPGQIYNSNRYTLKALVQSVGQRCVDVGTAADTRAATRDALLTAAESADIVVSTGGMSVGEEDHLKQALEEVGTLEMWRIAVKPGKPLAYGRIGNADFIGLPGNPVSALVTFCLFVKPFLLARLGAHTVMPEPVTVTAGFDWPKPAGRREFARARLLSDAGGIRAQLHERQSSDVLSSTTWAQGLVEIPEAVTLAKGDPVNWYSFAELLG